MATKIVTVETVEIRTGVLSQTEVDHEGNVNNVLAELEAAQAKILFVKSTRDCFYRPSNGIEPESVIITEKSYINVRERTPRTDVLHSEETT